MPQNVRARWNPLNRKIEFAGQKTRIPRGMVAEEIQHLIDEVDLGVTPAEIVTNYIVDTGAGGFREKGGRRWWHRRVFTRLTQNAQQGGHPLIRLLLGPGDTPSLFELSRQTGTENPCANLGRSFPNPYRPR